MISMARIQGSAMGYAGFQKPVVQMGQDSFSFGPTGAGVTPPAVPAFPTPYPPNYAFVEQTVPVPVPTPTSAPTTPLPTWAIVGLSVVAGAAVAALVMNK